MTHFLALDSRDPVFSADAACSIVKKQSVTTIEATPARTRNCELVTVQVLSSDRHYSSTTLTWVGPAHSVVDVLLFWRIDLAADTHDGNLQSNT